MKIGVIVDAISRGGAQSSMYFLIREWRTLGHDVRIVSVFDSRLENTGLKLDKQHFRMKAKSFVDLRAFWTLFNWIKKNEPNVIFANLFASQIWCACLKVFGYPGKLIWIEHNTYSNRTRFQWFFFRLFSRFTHKIFAVSEEVGDFLRIKGVTVPIVIVKNAIRPMRNLCTAPTDRDIRVVFIGRLVPQKNPLFAVQAFARAVQQRQIGNLSQLVFLGDGPLNSRIIEQAIVLGVQNRVEMLGYQEDDYDSVIETCHCLVSPSHFEGFGIARFEALSHGLCLLTSETAGTRSLRRGTLEPFTKGIYVSQLDVETWAQNLGQVSQKENWSRDLMIRRKQLAMPFFAENVAFDYLRGVESGT